MDRDGRHGLVEIGRCDGRRRWWWRWRGSLLELCRRRWSDGLRMELSLGKGCLRGRGVDDIVEELPGPRGWRGEGALRGRWGELWC